MGRLRDASGRAARAAAGLAVAALPLLAPAPTVGQNLAVRGEVVHTMGPAGTIRDGVVVVESGKIKAVGPAATTPVPEGTRVLRAAVVTPGLIDARCTLGLSGINNSRHDSDQLERSSPAQPELRAIDAYNPQEPLVAYVRGFGVTTAHTGHAPGELVSGQTFIVKLAGTTADGAAIVPAFAVAATLSPQAIKGGSASPGTRAKLASVLRGELIKAQEYQAKLDKAKTPPEPAGGKPTDGPDGKPPETPAEKAEKKPTPPTPPERNLRLEALAAVLRREMPLIVTAHRAQDIASALRIADEFRIRLILDGAAEAPALIEQIKAAGVPVIVHPTMMRAVGETENLSFTTAAKLVAAGVPTALQGGYEAYVPKARVVLFEAALAAANGCSFEQALALVTRDAAKLLGIDARVGTLEPGKDADLAMFSGDPLEYTTHCVGTIIDGKPVSEGKR
jgi:imidazolonepropionase-like amidohydrolase